MADVKVDVIRPQPFQACIQTIRNVCAAVNAAFRFFLRSRQKLRGDDRVFARGQFFERSADKLLARTAAITHSRVEKVYAEFERSADNPR